MPEKEGCRIRVEKERTGRGREKKQALAPDHGENEDCMTTKNPVRRKSQLLLKLAVNTHGGSLPRLERRGEDKRIHVSRGQERVCTSPGCQPVERRVKSSKELLSFSRLKRDVVLISLVTGILKIRVNSSSIS